MSIAAVASAPHNQSSSESDELMFQIPVWVHGKRKWVTGISKKTTFDDLIYALLVQAEILKATGTINSSSNVLPGYAIAECLQLTASSASNSNESEPPSLITQRIIKGRGKVIKAHKTWQFDKLPMTILHLIPTTSNYENQSSTAKFRSKIFRRFLPTKSPSLSSTSSMISSSQSDSSLISIVNHPTSSRHKSFNDFHENTTIIEQQKRLLDYLDEQIHQAETTTTPSPVHTLPKPRVPYHPDASSHEVTTHDVSRLFSHQIDQEDQLIFATQLCNSILNMQERLEEKTNVLYAVEQAISNELNHVLHQQHYDTLPTTISLTSNDNNNSSLSNDLISLKNSIYRSRELSRVQSKEMHDLDLSLREMEVLIASKYDELKYLEYETSNGRSLTPSYASQQQNYRTSVEETSTYETFDLPTLTTTSSSVFTSMKEMDEDSGINSLTSDDSNHHSVLLTHQKLPSQTTQLETLV